MCLTWTVSSQSSVGCFKLNNVASTPSASFFLPHSHRSGVLCSLHQQFHPYPTSIIYIYGSNVPSLWTTSLLKWDVSSRTCILFLLTFFGFYIFQVFPTHTIMAPKQRMRLANEKAMKNVTLRGNVPKTSVSTCIQFNHIVLLSITLLMIGQVLKVFREQYRNVSYLRNTAWLC